MPANKRHPQLRRLEPQKSSQLVRVMGRWTLTALVINSIIGNGIFGVPSIVAGYVGRWSPVAFLFAAAGVAVIMACFAEVASQFGQSGGPYLYARAAFGRFLGIETGWLLWLVRITATAAAVNLFTNYLAEFWPGINQTAPRLLTLTVLVGVLALINYRGVQAGAAASNMFTIAKLGALVAFALAGGIFILRSHSPGVFAPSMPAPSTRNWFEAMLVLLFTYGGFEVAVVPMSEARDPRRDIPVALLASLLTTATLFFVVQYVVVKVLPSLATASRPLAAAAREMWGGRGATLITLAALISLYGYLSAQMLHSPRLTFALAERGDFPAIFSRIHARFRTPHISILFFAATVWGMAAIGNFKANVMISSVGRVFVYGVVCAALPALRLRQPHAPAYRAPAGNLLGMLGVGFMLALMARMRKGEWIIILATVALAFVNWVLVRGRQHTGSTSKFPADYAP